MATGPSERAGSQTAGLGVLAVLAAGGFAVLTWLVATGVVIPFDQPMLATATAWTALTPTWHFLSDAANFPLIGIGVGLVAGLLLTHHRREAILVVVGPGPRDRGERAREAARGDDRVRRAVTSWSRASSTATRPATSSRR